MFQTLSTIAFPIHLITLGTVAVYIFISEKQGFAWIRGTKYTLDPTLLKKYHTYIFIGLAGMIMSGLVLFWPERHVLLTTPAFIIKMICVLALIINAFAIESLMGIPTTRPYLSITQREKMRLFTSGTISLMSWIGAGVSALFLLP